MVGCSFAAIDLPVANAELEVALVVGSDLDLNLQDTTRDNCRRPVRIHPVVATSGPLVSVTANVSVPIPAMLAVTVLGPIAEISGCWDTHETMSRHRRDKEEEQRNNRPRVRLHSHDVEDTKARYLFG